MTCAREPEVADVLMTGRWPDACDGELRAHAASCAVCGDLVLVCTAIAADTPRAEVPTSGVVWWRIQRRERQQAVAVASRTMTLVQASSILAAIAFILTIVGSLSFGDTLKLWATRAVELTNLSQWVLPLLFAFAVTLLLAPVAVYLAMRED